MYLGRYGYMHDMSEERACLKKGYDAEKDVWRKDIYIRKTCPHEGYVSINYTSIRRICLFQGYDYVYRNDMSIAMLWLWRNMSIRMICLKQWYD